MSVVRSACINGRRTSVSVEDDFWIGLREMSRAKGKSVQDTLSEIAWNDGDGVSNLSAAIRVAVLKHYRDLASRFA